MKRLQLKYNLVCYINCDKLLLSNIPCFAKEDLNALQTNTVTEKRLLHCVRSIPSYLFINEQGEQDETHRSHCTTFDFPDTCWLCQLSLKPILHPKSVCNVAHISNFMEPNSQTHC